MTETNNPQPASVTPPKIAIIQMTSSYQFEKNLEFLKSHIIDAAKAGAVYVQTPENSLVMDFDSARIKQTVASPAYKEGLEELIALASAHSITIHLGSVATLIDDETALDAAPSLANRSYLIRPSGSPTLGDSAADVQIYDKIHMFDVSLPNGDSYHESANYKAGDKAVVVDCGFAKVGMSICYDLRFPALYRHLAQKGAEVMTVPAAFTRITGKAHWHALLRARAIETGSFVIASAQTGEHDSGTSSTGGGRETFGHSLVVAPWGDVLLDAGEAPGLYFANLSMEQSKQARNTVPSLTHDRSFR